MELKQCVSAVLLVVVLMSREGNAIKVTACYGSAYAAPPAMECTAPASLHIDPRVEYGVSMCAGQSACCPKAGGTCTLKTDDDAHVLDLKAQCDGKQRCPMGLTAGRKQLDHCGGNSDYIVVTYDCVMTMIPPRIINLNNVTEHEGNIAKLKCVFEGDPPPSVTFQKQGTSRPYEDGENEGGRVMVSRMADNVLELTVNNLRADDTANYTCKAVNIGGDHSINGTIIAEFKPRFDPDHLKGIWSWPGKTRNMTCSPQGEPEPVIDWYLHDLERPIQNNASFKVYKMGRISVLQVKIRDEDDLWIYNDYRCKAENKYGQGMTSIELQKATIPGKPRASDVQKESPTMVILTVQPPYYDGGIEIYGYRVEYDSWSKDFKIGEEIKIENLHPSTYYVFRIRAKNEVGVGSFLEHTHTTEAIHPVTMPGSSSSLKGFYLQIACMVLLGNFVG